MPVKAMTIHDSKEPESFDTAYVLNDAMTILISFLDIWNHSHSCLETILVYYRCAEREEVVVDGEEMGHLVLSFRLLSCTINFSNLLA